MKSLYPLLVLLLISGGSLSAQIQKGSVLIGGTVGFNNVSAEGEGITIINVSPIAGFFLSNRFVLGAGLDANFLFVDGESTSTVGIAPFARYYLNAAGKTRFFGEAGLGVVFDDSSNGNALVFGLALGVDFFLNENVAIEASLGYNRFNYSDSDTGVNNIGLNIGVSAFINPGDKK